MKLAMISVGLFLLSYVAVNGGLGPRPVLLIIPVLVAGGSVLGARWLMNRRRAADPVRAHARPEDSFLDQAPPHRHVPQVRSPTPPRVPGGKARKLF